MDKKAIAWLYRQLPELVAKEIIPAESAERLKQHYGPVEGSTGTRTFLLVFGVIGALLIGLGIILILAHNWAQLTRLNRLIISLGLLVLTQIISGWVLWYKRDGVIWREAAATLQMLMIGAALALVGQTYHLVEDVDSFLLVWMLLSLPLIYLLNSGATAVLCVIGITNWASGGYFDVSKQFVWVLLGGIGPYYYRLLKNSRSTNTFAILSWVLLICFYICFAAAFSDRLERMGYLIYSALFALTYLTDKLWFAGQGQSGRLPFTAVGVAGSLIITFILTFNHVWRYIIDRDRYPATDGAYGLTVVLLVLVAAGIAKLAKERQDWRFALLPYIIALAYIVRSVDSSQLGALVIMNGCMLGLSISIIIAGVRRRRIGVVNLGMVSIAALIMARFLDVDVSFIVRGVVFVLIGICFLVANVVLVRCKAGWSNEK